MTDVDMKDLADEIEYGEGTSDSRGGDELYGNGEPYDEGDATKEAEGVSEGEEGFDEDAYARELVKKDVEELKGEFPELEAIEDITELDDPMRYAALRDLGLTAREAYLATETRQAKPKDNRAHLSPALTKPARTPSGGISRSELLMARSLFPDLSDTEIARLYKRATVR